MQHLKFRYYSLAGLSEKFCNGLNMLFLITVLTVVFLPANPVDGAMDLADEPLMTEIKPAPANIMILWDDSKSMTFEVLAAGSYEGCFPNPNGDEQHG